MRYPIVILGFDVTDEGYSLSNQFMANAIGMDYVKVVPQWWFSDFLAASWMKVADLWGLWGVRLGGVVGSSLIVMLVIRMISLVYQPNIALVITVLGAALFSHTGRILYYDNVPVLLFALFGFFFLKFLLDPSKRVCQVLSGILLALLILSKWPMMIILAIPILTWAAYYFIQRERAQNFLRSLPGMYGTAFFCLGLFFVYLSSRGLLSDYLSLYGLAEEHNKLSVQLFRWYWQLRTIVPLLLLLFGLPFLSYFATKKAKPTVALFAGLFILSLILSFFRSKWFCPFADVHVIHIITYLLSLSISSFCIYVIRNSLAIEEFALFLLGAALPLGQTLGSASGLGKLNYGMWLLGGIMLYLLLRVSKMEYFANCKSLLLSSSALLTVIISYYGVKQTYFYVGRDSSDLSQLSSEFQSPRLRGIYTTEKRRGSVDSLVGEIGKYAKKGDPILAYFHIPMIYYATSTVPVVNRVWFEAFLSAEKVKKMADELSPTHPPVVIVKAKTDTFNPNWGLNPTPLFSYAANDKAVFSEMQLMADILDRKTQELWNLQLVWSNPDFELYTAQ